MRIVIISDTHSLHDDIAYLPEGDILIHAGDIENSGRCPSDIRSYCDWLNRVASNYKKIIQISGNHDGSMQKYGDLLSSDVENLVYLKDSAYTYEGIKFFGSPYTPTFFNWYFMCDEDKISKHFDLIDDDTNILITHGPAYKILDKTFYSNQHVGSKTLLEKINTLKNLDVHGFGHIHEQYGYTNINNVTYINASICNLNYQPINAPIVFDYYKNERIVNFIKD